MTTEHLNSLDERLDAVAAAAKSVLFELEMALTEARKAAQHYRHAKLNHAMRDFVVAAGEPRV
jgi:hypothetical protein